jgi:4-amino-4-deoxy-L-arabinose transferase-like glycosyltransferase
MDGRRRRTAFVFAAALVVRGGFVLLEPHTRRVDDEPVWIALGQQLAAAGFSPLRDAQVFHPPLYPYFLGGLSAAFGGLAAVQWGQVLLGALIAPLLYRLGPASYGERAGLWTGAFGAFYPELVWYAAHFWSEIVFVTLLWWGFERLVAADEADRPWLPLAAGLLFGLAALTRETVLLFVPLAALWLVGGRAGGGRRAAVFVIAVAAVVLPWTIRNAVVTGAFVPVATRGSFNLWLGNTRDPWDAVYAERDATAGGPIAEERHARARALEAIAERQPAWIFEKIGRELPRFFGVNDQIVVHLERRAYKRLPIAANRAIAVLTIAPYLALLLLALPSLAAWPRDRTSLLLVGFLLFYVALHVLAFGSPRFRLAVLPVFFLGAGRALARGWLASLRELGGAARVRAAVLAAVLVACVAVSGAETVRDPAFRPSGYGDEPSR